MKTRIELSDNGFSAMIKLSGGNPGALNVLMRLMAEAGAIDPDDIMGGMGSVLFLDTLNIYEEKIWMLYKDICGEDIVKVVGLLRACQLGYLPQKELTSAINHPGGYGQMEASRIDELMKKVRERLPNFKR